MIQHKKFYCYFFLCLVATGCFQKNEKQATLISEETKKEATAFLQKFAAIRTAIPANPKAYLALFANDERFMIGGDDGFRTDYQKFYDRTINNPERLNPKWVTQFDLTFHDVKISQLDAGNLLFITYFDEFVRAKSGDTLSLKNNIIHGSLIKIDGNWKILSMLYAHNAADEKLDAEFDARNTDK